MTLWRLEWLRAIRSKRWIALAAGYLFFGLTGPVLVRYTDQIVKRFGGGVQIALPKPTPADGVAQYAKNAGQIGLIVLVIVAAGTMAIDSNPEWSAFLRTRVRSMWRLVVPRLTGMVALGGAAFVLGALGTWYETAVLLGAVPATGMIVGMLYGIAFIAFAVTVVAFATSLTRGVLGVVGVSLIGLLLMPVLGLVRPVQPWLPTQLLDAMTTLVRGGHVTDYIRALAVSAVGGAIFLWLAVRRLAAREI